MTRVTDLLATAGTALPPGLAPGMMPRIMPRGLPAFDWEDVNPIRVLAGLVGGAAASVWQENMTNIWSAGLWLTGLAFQLVDAFTSPDLSESGVMSKVYPFTFGIAAGLVVILAFVQMGLAAWQRDGKGVGRLIFGFFQFIMVWGGSIGVGAALTVATAGLTQGLLQVAFGAPSFGQANIKLLDWDVRPGIDAATATVLGLCGLLLVFAAIGYLLVMLVRAAALMILMATSPISAAGLLSEGTRAWFWKCLRWFISAQMIAPLAALVLGIGKLLTDGVLAGAGESTQAAVGEAVVGTVLVVVGAFCPLVMFRLLAFVDPGTGSGASFRASLDAAGGLSGLLTGGSSSGSGASDGGPATSKASNGTSQGEAAASTATINRVASALGGLSGPAGAMLGPAVSGLQKAGSSAAQFGGDVLAAAGVGHPQPYLGNDTNNPYDSNNPGDSNDSKDSDDSNGASGPRTNPAVPYTGNGGPGGGDAGDQGTQGGGTAGPPVGTPPPPSPPGGGSSGGGRKPPGGGGPGGSGGAGVSGGEAAAVAAV